MSNSQNSTNYGAVLNSRQTPTIISIPFSKTRIFCKPLTINGVIATSAGFLSLIIVFLVFASVPQNTVSNPSHNQQIEFTQERAAYNLKAEPVETTTRRGGRGGRRNNSTTQPTVRISQGTLRGTILKSRAGRDYNAFFTVPYGKPPVGNLRFQPPEPAEGWSGTRDATQKGSMCIQPERYNPNKTIVGSEDCLYVHIYTPKLPPRYGRNNQNQTKFPVITYFFGGGFMHGTANDFGGEYFMDEDVIIVLVESRVGALGFLNTGDLAATGNQGLKDQNLAMSWVKQNIEKFGGDPTKIIAFGTSSGATCAHLHLLSPMNAGIISGTMSFSGTALGLTMFDRNPRSRAVELAEALGCPDLENSANLVDCLRNATAQDIGFYQPSFYPSIEAVPADGNQSKTFLSDSPINLLTSGRFNKVPWLTGVNSAEAIMQSYSILLDPTQVDELNKNWDVIIPDMFEFQDTPTSEYAHKLRDFYFGDKLISNDTRFNLTNLLSDRVWVYPASLSAQLQTEDNSTVFMYYLTKEANVSWAADVTQHFPPPYGVSHADEVQYFFPRPRYPYIPLDSEYAEFSKMLVKYWVSFANTGVPIGPTEWPPVKESDHGVTFYNLDDEPKVVQPISERINFWNSLPLGVFFNGSSAVAAN